MSIVKPASGLPWIIPNGCRIERSTGAALDRLLPEAYTILAVGLASRGLRVCLALQGQKPTYSDVDVASFQLDVPQGS
jgi:hypothetical protein